MNLARVMMVSTAFVGFLAIFVLIVSDEPWRQATMAVCAVANAFMFACWLRRV